MSELGDKLRKRAEALELAAGVAFSDNDYSHHRELEHEAQRCRRQAREADAGLDPYRHFKDMVKQ